MGLQRIAIYHKNITSIESNQFMIGFSQTYPNRK